MHTKYSAFELGKPIMYCAGNGPRVMHVRSYAEAYIL